MVVPISRQTEIIDEEVKRALIGILEEANAIFPDDGLPGDVKLRGQEKLDSMMAMVTDFADLPKLMDPNYELLFRAGLEEPPVSPRLLTLLRIPGEFTKISKEIIRLARAGQEEEPVAVVPEGVY